MARARASAAGMALPQLVPTSTGCRGAAVRAGGGQLASETQSFEVEAVTPSTITSTPSEGKAPCVFPKGLTVLQGSFRRRVSAAAVAEALPCAGSKCTSDTRANGKARANRRNSSYTEPMQGIMPAAPARPARRALSFEHTPVYMASEPTSSRRADFMTREPAPSMKRDSLSASEEARPRSRPSAHDERRAGSGHGRASQDITGNLASIEETRQEKRTTRIASDPNSVVACALPKSGTSKPAEPVPTSTKPATNFDSLSEAQPMCEVDDDLAIPCDIFESMLRLADHARDHHQHVFADEAGSHLLHFDVMHNCPPEAMCGKKRSDICSLDSRVVGA
eukprot:gnl/TRDRNA2_/TRDRNA2_174823_c0_seq1.p1 gnl/TRDRNA2_/TRDRNA2_174823_c0~~gnl/TRDRNA2_/TRDRNA2_174823_c0_seq1.p1  ORF type:complete len:336 (-),score=32.47 gnl/TRDRNA2_/TRDRNA2_174823_c0_seq1:162-1169(-)